MSDGKEAAENGAMKMDLAAEPVVSEQGGDGDTHEPVLGVAAAVDAVSVVEETTLDAVVTRVLDASDVANKTASIAANSTGQLIAATEAMQGEVQKARMHSVIVLGICGFAMIAAVCVFTVMALQLQSRIDAADATVLAVGKRVVQLNSGIGSIKQIDEIMGKINERQQVQELAIEKLVARLDTGMAELRKAQAEQVGKAAKAAPVAPPQPPQLDPRVLALQAQIKALESQLQAQLRTTAKVADQLATMQVSLVKINDVARNVETLLSMERQKPVVSTPVATAPKEKERVERPNASFVRYPQLPKEAAKSAVDAAPGAH
jgi:uncharacterized coiled-coil protein SlyX